MKTTLLVIVMLVASVASIQIAVNSIKERCMVVYTTNHEDELKIDIKFPKIQYKNLKNQYLVQLINTETDVTEKWSIEMGILRKQISLTENVVYKLCIKIVLSERGSVEMQEYVDYNTAVRHNGNIYEHEIKVPENLLKVSDLHESYKNLVTFMDIIQQVKGKHNENKDSYDTMFVAEKSKIQKIEFISFIELAAICLLGAFQFFRLKNVIENRQG